MSARIAATWPLPEELVALAVAQRAQVPQLSVQLVELLRDKTDCYRRVARDYPEELRRVCEVHLESALSSLIESRDVDLVSVLRTGRAQARIGIALPDALRAYRLAGTFVYESLLAPHRVTPEQMLQASTLVWRVIDTFSEALATAYREVETERGRLGSKVRSELLDAVLEGRTTARVDPEDLGLPQATRLVVIVSDDPGVVDAVGAGALWRRREINVGIAPVGPGLKALQDAVIRGVVGVSAPFTDLSEVPNALHRAKIARRSRPQGAGGVVMFGDLPVATLVASTPALAGELAQVVFAGVLALPLAEREVLLTTLEAWYAVGGSAKDAGKSLYVHPNTVRYRLRRLEDLTGRDLDRPQGVAELYLALQAVRLGL
ncbi:MAG: helix-turn-helix domain-containing protein [Kibdelosporangium sp.]